MANNINQYIKEIASDSEHGTESTFRPALRNLLKYLAATEAVAKESGKIDVIHEQKSKMDDGKPDFTIKNDGEATIGFIECKKPGVNLDNLIGGEQLNKYAKLSDNALLTDYWCFILLKKGKKISEVNISSQKPADKQKLQDLITDFLTATPKPIDDPKILAEVLARRCRALCNELEKELQGIDDTNAEQTVTSRELSGLFHDFEKTLYHNITPKDFADALAQTLTYTLLMAKLNAPVGENLSIYGLKQHIPKSFALIRGISSFLENLEDTPLKHLVDSILAVINVMDNAALTEKSKGGTEEDPYFYFYENFLAAYNAKLRESRGVYYTPQPLVKFITRATDDILRRDFDKSDGLGDSSVVALDFAAGTGTFMLEMMRIALENKSQAKRDIITRQHLLKNFFGFELLIAPYVISHLKLSAFLSGEGVEIKDDERINIFLTNTLENDPLQKALPFIPALSEEVKRAQEIKEQQILVITGNPPYSINSQTPSKIRVLAPTPTNPNRTIMQDTWIGKKMRDYYLVDGKPLKEKNPKALQDDYVKFIRFAQWKVAQMEQGIIAIITNHAFLDNVTFPGMRQSLLNTFDRLYFLDMHGNSKRKETTPDGGKDENIFDIQQGVAVSLLVKKPGLTKGIFHADMWGARAEKYNACVEQTIDTIPWKELHPTKSPYFFIPRNAKLEAKYEEFDSLTDIFSVNNCGIKTARDALTIQYKQEKIQDVVKQFANMPPEKARDHFGLGQDSRDWEISLAQKDLLESNLNTENVRPIAYRPFDTRYTYYTGKTRGFHSYPRREIMRHMLAGDNLGLISVRQASASETWQHVFITDNIAEMGYISNKTKEVNYLFPLYRYEVEMDKIVRYENFTTKFRDWINDRYKKTHTPEDILCCIYALLHSPDYRQQYAEFLRTDYPRIPFPQDNKQFIHLVKIGRELMDAHLLRKHCGGEIKLGGNGTSHKVEKIYYDERLQQLHFNKDEYLSPITPEIYNFEIGGYKPLDKFLKYRKGCEISSDIETLEKAANAIAFTIRKIKEI